MRNKKPNNNVSIVRKNLNEKGDNLIKVTYQQTQVKK